MCFHVVSLFPESPFPSGGSCFRNILSPCRSAFFRRSMQVRVLPVRTAKCFAMCVGAGPDSLHALGAQGAPHRGDRLAVLTPGGRGGLCPRRPPALPDGPHAVGPKEVLWASRRPGVGSAYRISAFSKIFLGATFESFSILPAS